MEISMDYKKLIETAVDQKQETILSASDRIFDYAELGFHEFKSAKLLEEVLTQEGFQVETGIDGMPTAFKACYGSGHPVIGFLAEYDALPELSQKGGCTKRIPAEGENPDGHGCGHNLLGAGTLAAALAVKEYLKESGKAGTVILFGCPSEEKGNSKTLMARDGVFDGVDVAFTWHPSTENCVVTRSTLANVSAFFRFKGVTSHAAASPEMGRSALDAAELMSVGVNYLREHTISDARIHYAYRDVGGIAPNVVQGHSCVHYFVRAPKLWQVKEIYKRVVDVAEGAAKMTGTEMSCELYAGLSDFMPNHVVSGVLQEALEAVGAPAYDEEDFKLARAFFYDGVSPEELEAKKAAIKKKFGPALAETFYEKPLDTHIAPLAWKGGIQSGSSDVGDASYVMPTAWLSTATATLGTAGHTWQMAAHGNTGIAHKAMLTAGKVLALAAVRFYEEPELAEAAKKELAEETGGVYECPIPKEIGPRLED